MPLTDSEIRALKAGEKMKDFSAGPGLRIRLEPAKKGGGKSFYGYMYFPPGGGGKKVWVCIGPYGKGPGKWSLKDAWDECETRLLENYSKNVMVFEREPFETEVRKSFCGVLTEDEIKESGDMLLPRLGHGIRFGYLRFGLKKTNRGW